MGIVASWISWMGGTVPMLSQSSRHKRQRSHSDSGCIKDHQFTGCGVIQFRIAGFGNLRIFVLLPHACKSEKGSGAVAYSYLLSPSPSAPSPGFQGSALFTLWTVGWLVKGGDEVRRSSCGVLVCDVIGLRTCEALVLAVATNTK